MQLWKMLRTPQTTKKIKARNNERSRNDQVAKGENDETVDYLRPTHNEKVQNIFSIS